MHATRATKSIRGRDRFVQPPCLEHIVPVPGAVLGGGTTGMYKHRQNQIPVHHPTSQFS